MKMVFISKTAYTDLDAIFIGMLTWNKIELSVGFVESYIDDILVACYELNDIFHHFPAAYPEHKRFGNFIHRYRRNARTVWYIVYDKDPDGNIFINKIVSNHLTQ